MTAVTIVQYSFLFLIFTLLLSISICVSGSGVYKKANKSSGLARIPIYNLYSMAEIIDIPLYYFVMLFIPIVNIYAIHSYMKRLNEVFHGPVGFEKHLFILPIVYLPMLTQEEFIYRLDEEDVSYLLEEDENYKEVSKEQFDDSDYEQQPVVDSIYKGKTQQKQTGAGPYKANKARKEQTYFDDDDDND